MNNYLYDMIFKRKSFHLFRNIGNEHITDEELKNIENEFNKLKPLVDDIKVKIKIVKEHLNDGITLKELKEKYGISNDHIKYMIALPR